MTVREYIGARYVPLFMGEWDDTVSYEPLSIVTYQGDSYTSRQAVPVGIEITNETYWAVTGGYNAQIEAYRQEVLSFNNRITTCETSIDTLETDAANLKNRGKIIIAIGDSYGEGWDPDTSTSHDGWCENLASYLSNAGIICKYAYRGGAGFASTTKFLTLLQNIVNGMTANEKARCEKVLVAGGFNDRLQSEADIKAGIKEVATYIKNNLPNALLYVSHVGYCVTNLTNGSHAGATAHDCVNSYRRYNAGCNEAAAKFDCGSITTLRANTYFTSDYVHPNSSGNRVIAKRMVNFLFDGTAISENVSVDDYFTANNGWSVYSTSNTALYMVDGNSGFCKDFLIQNYLEIRRDSALTHSFSIGSSISIGQINLAGISGVNYATPIFGVIHQAEGGFIEFEGVLYINNSGNASLRIVKINSEGNNYLNVNIDRIQIKSTECTFM